MRYMLLFMIVGLVCANILLNTAQPEIETSLALEQFENPSVVTDTVYRNYHSVSSRVLNILALLCLGLYTLLTFFGKKGN